jgi:AraC-like DNA-binding protein
VAEPTIAAGMARGLTDLAVAKGADRGRLLALAGLDADAIDDHDLRLPFSAYVTLMRAAKAMTGDAALALHYGEAIDVAEFSIVGLIGQASATVTEAFAQLNRYVRLIVETDGAASEPRFKLRFRGGGAWVEDTRAEPNAFPELTESAFAHLICGTRQFGTTPLALAVHVTHPDPGYRSEYERILGAPVTFEAGWNAIRIDPTWADHQVARLPRYAFGVLTDKADALLADLDSSKSVAGQVEARLLPILHTGEAGMDAVAASLGMSRQTLLRRLRAEGTAFAKVLDQLRQRLALSYLRRGKASINEIAYLVGFADPAAFSRAFKRWTGKTPGAARQDYRGEER